MLTYEYLLLIAQLLEKNNNLESRPDHPSLIRTRYLAVPPVPVTPINQC